MYGIVLHCQNFLSSSPSQQQQLFKWKHEIDREYKPQEKSGALTDKYNIAPRLPIYFQYITGGTTYWGRDVRVKAAVRWVSSDASQIF